MKRILRTLLFLLCTPLRHNYRRRNGVTGADTGQKIPNEALLGLARDMIRQGHTATISVRGYSMRPFLEHCRDRVILSSPHTLQVGDAVLAEIAPGKFVLHRIIDIQGDRLTLMGDGNIQGVEHCRRSDVAGVVTHYLRPRRTLLASDPVLCRRIRMWRRLLPIRRYLLFVYRNCI